MCCPLLPAVIPTTQEQQLSLLSINEEEHSKAVKDKKDFKDSILNHASVLFLAVASPCYLHTNTAIAEAPLLSSITPPPDVC